MPQGRKKTPFSGKAKKDQLKAKKHRKQNTNVAGHSRSNILLKGQSDDESSDADNIQKLNYQPNKKGQNPNRYALHFFKESDADIQHRKERARQALEKVEEKQFEINIDDYFSDELSFPKRPKWSFNLTKEALDGKENKYFLEYINELQNSTEKSKMGYFEQNLETWRQLWRVLEMSDIVLLIVDVRLPALMFPPSLYDYVTKTLKKHMILILNKIDLVPDSLIAAWKNYLLDKFPNLKVLLFTTVPMYNLIGKQSDKAGLNIRRRRGTAKLTAEGAKLLLDACKDIVGDKVDLTSWEHKIKEESLLEFADDKIEVAETIEINNDAGYVNHESFLNGILTIGCIGQPNVGKSSIMNAIMGKKVVSVSKTPGHTKHFQTIFITPTIKLCDCPGLVFPSKVPKELQVIMGSFPIAQLREPYTTIKYLAERLDLPKLLRIHHPENDVVWSAMDICDGWAKKRGYLTAKAARFDSYRAANSLLRMAVDGKISLCLTPVGYTENKSEWETHPDIALIQWIKGKPQNDVEYKKVDKDLTASSEEDEDSPSGDDETDSHEESNDNSNIKLGTSKNMYSALTE